MSWMLKNSAGKPDGIWTCAVISFFVVSVCILLSILGTVSVGEVDLKFQKPDSTLLLGYLAACFTSYVVRRNKKDQIELDESVEEMKNGILGE